MNAKQNVTEDVKTHEYGKYENKNRYNLSCLIHTAKTNTHAHIYARNFFLFTLFLIDDGDRGRIKRHDTK